MTAVSTPSRNALLDALLSGPAIEERFVRSSGPGGQNVNKVATAVQLRFNVKAADGLSHVDKARLLRLAGARATKAGVIVIEASRHRTQEMNRVDARARLRALIERALKRAKKRVATRPTLASKKRRLDSKKRRGAVKEKRGAVRIDD